MISLRWSIHLCRVAAGRPNTATWQMTLDPYSSVTDSHDFYCCVPEKNIMKVRLHDHVNSDHPTTNCCPSQQTTQRSPAVRSAQLRLVFGTVYQLHSNSIHYQHFSTTPQDSSFLRQHRHRLTVTIHAYDSNFCFDIWRVTNADYLLTYLLAYE